MRRWRRNRVDSWVASVGVSGVLGVFRDAGHPVTRQAVYSWLHGRAVPRLDHAAVLMRASGATVDDLLALRQKKRAAGPTAPDCPMA